MRRKLFFPKRILAPFTLIILITNINHLVAQDHCIWTGAGSDSSWHTPDNWDCDAHNDIPTANDAVTIAPEGTVTVDLGEDTEFWSLELGIDNGSSHSEAHILRTAVDDIELMASGEAVIVRQTGRLNLGQSRVPFGIGSRPALRATLVSPEPLLVHGRLFVANSTILADVTLERPEIGGARGSLQARGWNNVHGTLHVVNGFLQPVVPGGYHGTGAPHLRVVDHDLIVDEGASVQLFADTGTIVEPAIAVEGGIFDHRGTLTTSSFPNAANAPFIIDAVVVNEGNIHSRLARPGGLEFRGPASTVHQNSGLIEIGAILGSDSENNAVDGFGFLVDPESSLHNTGEILIHRLRSAEGTVSNTGGGIIFDDTEVDGAGTYILGLAGPQAVEVEIMEPGNIELLSMSWHGEDHPNAGLNQHIDGTGNWWSLSATTLDMEPASGNLSLGLPRFNDHIPQMCRFRDDPAGWDCFVTSFNTQRTYISDLNELSEWTVAEYPPVITNDLLDPDFGHGGVAVHEIQERDQSHDLILEPDGSLIVFGESSVMGNIPQTRGGTFTRFDPEGNVMESRLFQAWAGGCGDVPQVFNAGKKLNNGQFITAGYREVSCSGIPRYFVVIRHNADGTVDQVFDDAVFHDNIATAFDLAVQADDKIVAAGRASTSGHDFSSSDIAVARYHSDGTLDEGFGDQGEVTFDIDGDFDMIRAVALQENGKIVAGGVATTATGLDFLLLRLHTDGSLDMDFGTDGMVLHDFNGFDDMIRDMEIQEDGKIVVAGRTTDADGTTIKFTSARYHTDGTLDTGFGDNGVVFVDFGGPDAFAEALKIGPEGRIYLAGTTESGGGGEDTREAVLAVLNPDGSPEQEFGDEGKQVFDFGFGPIDEVRALDINPATGQIALAGHTGRRIDGELWLKTGVARFVNNMEPGLLSPVVLMLPVNNSEIDPEEVFFEWEEVPGAETYRVQVSEDSGVGSVFFDTTLSQTTMTFPETMDEAMSYYWRVKALNENTESDWSETWSFTTSMATTAGNNRDLPGSFELYQSYPNPFNPTTRIRYALPADTHVQLVIYNMLGRRIAIPVNERQRAGYHSIDFDGTGISSGIYIYQIKAGEYIQSRRMTLIQ